MRTIEIFDDNYSADKIYEQVRYAVRAVILDGRNIYIEYAKSQPIIMLPGGGVEGKESNEECIVRECKEECGIIVDPLEQLFVIKEYYKDMLFHSCYVLCKTVGNCQNNLTPAEKKLELRSFYRDISLVYSDLKDILNSVQDRKSQLYGMNYREYRAVEEILNIVQNQ